MPRKHYDVFKHKVRTKLPKRIRYATVCRGCKKAKTISQLCLTCKIEQAKYWAKPYWGEKMKWEDILKQDVSELEKIAKELDKAIAMHTSQAKRIREYVKKVKGN